MPLYEYQCDACGHRFEKIQKFSDPIVDTCPVCGGAVRKLISSPAIQFKGSGFYITDYPKKDQGGTDKSEKSEKSDGGSAGKAATSDSSGGKADKGEKAATPAASDKSASTPSTSSSSGSKESSSSSTPKTST
jgi:putative FmdB family regulatory protein